MYSTLLESVLRVHCMLVRYVTVCYTLLYTTLYYPLLYFIIFGTTRCCIALDPTLLYSTVPYSTLLHSTPLYPTLAYSTLLCCTILCQTMPCYTSLRHSTLSCIRLRYTPLPHATFYFTSPSYEPLCTADLFSHTFYLSVPYSGRLAPTVLSRTPLYYSARDGTILPVDHTRLP